MRYVHSTPVSKLPDHKIRSCAVRSSDRQAKRIPQAKPHGGRLSEFHQRCHACPIWRDGFRSPSTRPSDSHALLRFISAATHTTPCAVVSRSSRCGANTPNRSLRKRLQAGPKLDQAEFKLNGHANFRALLARRLLAHGEASGTGLILLMKSQDKRAPERTLSRSPHKADRVTE